MIRVVCINANVAKKTKLSEGSIYTCDGNEYTSPVTGNACYHIIEINALRRVNRFMLCSNIDEMDRVVKKDATAIGFITREGERRQ